MSQNTSNIGASGLIVYAVNYFSHPVSNSYFIFKNQFSFTYPIITYRVCNALTCLT